MSLARARPRYRPGSTLGTPTSSSSPSGPCPPRPGDEVHSLEALDISISEVSSGMPRKTTLAAKHSHQRPPVFSNLADASSRFRELLCTYPPPLTPILHRKAPLRSGYFLLLHFCNSFHRLNAHALWRISSDRCGSVFCTQLSATAEVSTVSTASLVSAEAPPTMGFKSPCTRGAATCPGNCPA